MKNTQLMVLIKRLRKPSVILSIVSQVISILLLLNIKIDTNIITGIATSICSILVILGIMSNPESESKGYSDNIYLCKNCNKQSLHVKVKGVMVCSECGCVCDEYGCKCDKDINSNNNANNSINE